MKNKFISFKKGESKGIYDKFPKKERDIIEQFVKYVSITSTSQKRLENNKRTLIHFKHTTQKEFDKITLQDLRDYLSLLKSSDITNSSQNDYKATIKRFLKWRFKDWSKRFNNLEDIKLHLKINEEKINSDSLITKEDVEKIVKEEKSTFWRAFFLTLYESGLRPSELRTLTWDKIKFNIDKDISEINIYASKTHKSRSVYVKEATFYLKKLKEQREDINNPLVFPSIRDKTKPISKDYVSHWLSRISQKAIGRKIFPYILRHSRATELYTNSNIPDKITQKFLGHNKSMSDVYTHLSNKDVKEAVGKTIYKFEDLPPEKKHELEKAIEDLKESNTKQDKKIQELTNKFKVLITKQNKILGKYKDIQSKKN